MLIATMFQIVMPSQLSSEHDTTTVLRHHSRRNLCRSVARSPLRYHNMSKFLKIQPSVRSMVTNPFLNDTYPISEQMLERCHLSQRPEDLVDFHRVLLRAEQSKALRVCAIGGSETSGMECTGRRETVSKALNGSKDPLHPHDCAWLGRFGDWLKLTYPDWKLTITNMARTGYHSQASLGTVKTRGVNCDLVIVEQSMNDEALLVGSKDPSVIAEATENILNELLKQAQQPAVIYLVAMRFFPDARLCTKNSTTVLRQEALTLQEIYLQVLSEYHVPLISYRDVVAEDLKRLECSGPHGSIGPHESQQKALVLHSGGRHGAHVDWRAHQLLADVLVWWWRSTMQAKCTEHAERHPTNNSTHKIISNQSHFHHSLCFGKQSIDKNDTLQQGFPGLQPSQHPGWYFFSEKAGKPSGWHPHPSPAEYSMNGNSGNSVLARNHSRLNGEITFIVRCGVETSLNDRGSTSVLASSRGGLKVGFLRTWDQSWGTAAVWTSFHRQGKRGATSCESSSNHSGCSSSELGAEEMAAAGFEPLPRGSFFLNSTWSDKSSMNMIDEIPCYQSRSQDSIPLQSMSHFSNSSQAIPGTVEVAVHIEMERIQPQHAAEPTLGPGSILGSLLKRRNFRLKSRRDGSETQVSRFKLVSLESC